MNIQQLIKQSKFESPQQMAYINLVYTYYYFHEKHCALLKPHGILPQHYNVLKIVKGRHPNPVTPSHILAVMLDKKRDLTRLVDKLVDLGLLNRSHCPDNKRYIHISLSETGLELTLRLEEELKTQLVHHLDDKDSALLSDLLDRMR